MRRVVDAVSDAELPEPPVLRSAGRADDLGAPPAADLDRCLPDAAGRRMDENSLTLAHVSEMHQHEPRRQVVDRDRRGLFERQAVRYWQHERLGNAYDIAVAAEPSER